MKAFRKRGDPVRLLGRRLLLGALCALVVAGLFGVWNIYRKERESAALNTQAQSQLADLKKQQSTLETNISKLQTARGKEEELRQEYALAAKGEQMIVIVDPASGTAPAATSSAFAQWVHTFFPWW